MFFFSGFCHMGLLLDNTCDVFGFYLRDVRNLGILGENRLFLLFETAQCVRELDS